MSGIQIPTVLRARGFRLYLSKNSNRQDNRRLVDLWLNGGAAVLGHTPPNLLRELKNTASRGLYAPFPHFSEGRFIKALFKLFQEPSVQEPSVQEPSAQKPSAQGYSFRLYAAPPQELITLFESGTAKLWRPFTDPASPFAVNAENSIFIPVLPGIQTWRTYKCGELPLGLCVAAVRTNSAESEKLLTQLPPNDTLPPVLLAVAARGVHDLLAAPQRVKPNLPQVFKALKNSRWIKQGIYLTLKEKPDCEVSANSSAEEWETLFHKFLNAGFLLPPTPSLPVILPGELSNGEEAKLAALISEHP
jgi:hypothetical protein